MNEVEQKSIIKENILSKIREKQITMRPKAYFIAQIVALSVVAFVCIVLAAFIFSFILFSIKVSGHLYLLGFGSHGFLVFFLLFPWWILLLEVLLLAVFDRLIKRFKFGYSRTTFGLFVIAAALTVLAGLILYSTPVNRLLLESAEQKRLPIVGSFYRPLRHPAPENGFIIGTVTSVNQDIFIISHDNLENTEEGRLRRIIIEPNVQIDGFVVVGDRVFVAGRWLNNELHAYGIKKLFPGDDMWR